MKKQDIDKVATMIIDWLCEKERSPYELAMKIILYLKRRSK